MMRMWSGRLSSAAGLHTLSQLDDTLDQVSLGGPDSFAGGAIVGSAAGSPASTSVGWEFVTAFRFAGVAALMIGCLRA